MIQVLIDVKAFRDGTGTRTESQEIVNLFIVDLEQRDRNCYAERGVLFLQGFHPREEIADDAGDNALVIRRALERVRLSRPCLAVCEEAHVDATEDVLQQRGAHGVVQVLLPSCEDIVEVERAVQSHRAVAGPGLGE